MTTREVITPWMAKQQAQSVSLAEQLKAQQKYRREVMQRVAEQLEAAWADLSEPMRRHIRMQVALSVPDKPMSADELQLYLDERCVGVIRYMQTGKIV